MELIVQCESCYNKFSVDKSKLKRMNASFNGNGDIALTFFDCPVCNKRHYVQADNSNTLELLSICTKHMFFMAKQKQSGIKIQQKHTEQFNKMRADLDEARSNLMKELHGKIIHDLKNNVMTEVRFSQ